MAAPELLESGPADDDRWARWLDDHRRAVTVALVGVTAGAVAVGLAWSLRPQPPLTVADATVVGSSRLIPDPRDGGASGALGAPAMTSLPMTIVSLSVRNDSDAATDVRVVPRTLGGLRIGFGSTAAGLPAWSQATVPAYGTADVPMTVSPTDCAHRPTEDDVAAVAADLLGVVTGHGGEPRPDAVGPPAPTVAETIATALERACSTGDAATVSVSGSPREAGGVTTVALRATADPDTPRLVVTPLDDAGRRGLGSVSRAGSGPVAVMWESTGDVAGPPRVQVFTVDGSLAVPYLLDVESP